MQNNKPMNDLFVVITLSGNWFAKKNLKVQQSKTFLAWVSFF